MEIEYPPMGAPVSMPAPNEGLTGTITTLVRVQKTGGRYDRPASPPDAPGIYDNQVLFTVGAEVNGKVWIIDTQKVGNDWIGYVHINIRYPDLDGYLKGF